MQLVDPRPSRPIPIRITPLIDVVFILLVFFMLTTRLLPVDHLELSNNTRDRSSASGDPLPELQVTAGGMIRWQDSRYALAELLPALNRAGVSEANLTTTPEASLADFTLALSALDDAGIKPHWKRNASSEL
ncbi:biopolymer transporter ExbD [Marinobacter sp. SS5-14b]|uniref:ExbD/TolR family protein n=1 Tax=Marinobacter sp. SS5-14b TaxID=3050456 RepID=UPI0026DFF351|nr:biopolymer transporter ExbD [Marinobacter sp. SS5-14b]